jgi:hypothetical protein
LFNATVARTRPIFRKASQLHHFDHLPAGLDQGGNRAGNILALFLGWRFARAELLGAPFMAATLALLFRGFLSRAMPAAAARQSGIQNTALSVLRIRRREAPTA